MKMETLTEQLKNYEVKIQSLKDQDLLQTLQKLLDREKRIGDAILLALKEIRTRRLYAAMGYSSLFEMLVKQFNLSESSTYTRLQALKLMDAIPEIQEDLTKGDLSLSNAALVQGFIQRNEKEKNQSLTLEEKKEIVELVKNKSNREAKIELANKDPQIALPPEKEKPLPFNHTQLQITVDAETMGILSEVKHLLSHTIPDGNLKEILKYMLQLTAQILKKRKGQDIKVKAIKSEINQDQKIEALNLFYNSNQSKKIGESNCSFAAIQGNEIRNTNRSDETIWDKKRGTSNISYKSIQNTNEEDQTFTASKQSPTTGRDKVNFLTDGGTDVKVKTHCKTKLDPDVYQINQQTLFLSQSSRGTRFIPQETRFISQETKRKVFQRSGGFCEFIGKNGKRCHSKHQLEWDHVIPWSQGGGNDEKSLRVYCRSHNQYRTKETHGFWYREKNHI